MPPRRLNPEVPRDLETICLKCLEKEPAGRYATAAELAADLGRWREGRPILSRRARLPERSWRWCRRNPMVASLVATVTLLLLFIAIGSSLAALGLRREQQATLVQLGRALSAERDGREQLWGSYLAQARAGRHSGRVGQRFDGFEALAKATALGIFPERAAELRTEAIACLALEDVRFVRALDPTHTGAYNIHDI